MTPLQVLVLTKQESHKSGKEKSYPRLVGTRFIRSTLALNLGARHAVAPCRDPRELCNLKKPAAEEPGRVRDDRKILFVSLEDKCWIIFQLRSFGGSHRVGMTVVEIRRTNQITLKEK